MISNEYSNKSIIMACTQPYWSPLQVGSQHLARQFANHGWRVHYFSSPVTFLHLAKIRSHEIRKRLNCSIYGRKVHYRNSIYSYIVFSLFAPFGFPIFRSERLIYQWHKTIIPSIKSQLKKYSIDKISLLYIDNIFFHFLLDIIDYKSSLFRVIDEHNRFHGWNNNAKKIAKLIANKCDTIIYSAKGLEHYVSQLNPERSFLVPNGVDLSLFQKHSQFGKFERHSLLKSISDPLILYSGMIDSRIDFRLLKWAALQLPFISFVLIGPFGENAPPRNLPKNIYFLGSVPHKELPSLIHSARAGIIPFDSKNKMKRIRGIRPLKLFEYMAAGIPVITSRWPEIESLQSPAWIYDSKEEFITLINKAVEHSHSQKTFTNFAKRHDWKNVFNQLLYYTNKV